ncbi:MAG: histidine triad family protein [Acidobacteriota bacterium]|jgi:histidine triad (HIT) family protein|nr:histidine triad family protein [Acidobacteriota bacterium]
MTSAPKKACVFCAIARGETEAFRVFEDELCVAFLDHRPLLHGHCLLVPKTHVETLPELPEGLVAPLFGAAQLLSRALEMGLAADGSFLAINNKVSQSVPHLHVHVVPRWKNDGLFSAKLVWKRTPYKSDAERRAVQEKIRQALVETD